jgi:hypothetical protein
MVMSIARRAGFEFRMSMIADRLEHIDERLIPAPEAGIDEPIMASPTSSGRIIFWNSYV